MDAISLQDLARDIASLLDRVEAGERLNEVTAYPVPALPRA